MHGARRDQFDRSSRQFPVTGLPVFLSFSSIFVTRCSCGWVFMHSTIARHAWSMEFV